MDWRPRPGTHAGRMVVHLQTHPEGVSDADLVQALSGHVSHNVVYKTCRALEDKGVITRRQIGPRTRNFLVLQGPGSAPVYSTPLVPAVPEPPLDESKAHAWYWEGNVQTATVALLAQEGWSIRRVANTATREPGKDIEAERDGVILWVTVKGFYEGANRSISGNWARHSFEAAVLDVILWRGENPSAHIAVALPAMRTYQSLAARVDWFQHAVPFTFVWVNEEGAAWG